MLSFRNKSQKIVGFQYVKLLFTAVAMILSLKCRLIKKKFVTTKTITLVKDDICYHLEFIVL
jgi:hypothetical protein